MTTLSESGMTLVQLSATKNLKQATQRSVSLLCGGSCYDEDSCGQLNELYADHSGGEVGAELGNPDIDKMKNFFLGQLSIYIFVNVQLKLVVYLLG